MEAAAGVGEYLTSREYLTSLQTWQVDGAPIGIARVCSQRLDVASQTCHRFIRNSSQPSDASERQTRTRKTLLSMHLRPDALADALCHVVACIFAFAFGLRRPGAY